MFRLVSLASRLAYYVVLNSCTITQIALFALVAVAIAEPEGQHVVAAAAAPVHYTAGMVHHLASGAVVPQDTASVQVAKAQHHAAKAYANMPYHYQPFNYYYQMPYVHQTVAPYVYTHHQYVTPNHLVKRNIKGYAYDDEVALNRKAKRDAQTYYYGTYLNSYAAPAPFAYAYAAPAVRHAAYFSPY